MASTTCSICCEDFNKARHKPAMCQFCDFSACTACVRQFLVSQPADPQCMSCKAVWDREALERLLPKSFLTGDYKTHREQVLFDREKARLPQTQERAHAEKQARALEILNNESMKQYAALKEQLRDLTDTIRTNQHTIDIIRHTGRAMAHTPAAAATVATKARFTSRCPSNTCKGFLDQTYTCGMCDLKCCKDCFEPLEEGHACNPDNVATATLLKKDTRSCPNCAVPIHKIEGCQQMFCTECHTAFDWQTGAIEKGRIHNPHYYEWMRRQGGGGMRREVGDIPCGGFPNLYQLNEWLGFGNDRVVRRTNGITRPGYIPTALTHMDMLKNEVTDAHRFFVHVEEVALREYRVGPNDQDHTELRVNYLLGDLTEEAMKRELHKREKAVAKKQAIAQVLEMLVITAGDVARTNMTQRLTNATMEMILAQWQELKIFANEAMVRVATTYDCVVPYCKTWQDGLVKMSKKALLSHTVAILMEATTL